MEEKDINLLTEKLQSVVDSVMEEKLAKAVGPMIASETKKVVEQLRVQRALLGKDITGLSEKQKKDFVEVVRATITGARIDTKANEALIEEQDNRGGYLVSKEVANAILRIAATVGVVLSQAQKWPMATDEKSIPAYTGSFLEGEYLGVDTAGNLTGLTFEQATLIAKKWQLAFVVGNDLLADADVNVADWLLSLAGEALANRIDKEAFIGSGAPFVGLLNDSGVPVYTMPSGEDTFAEFTLDDASDMIAQVEESVLDGAGFYFERTVWAKIRMKKDTAGYYVIAQALGNALVQQIAKAGGPKPAGAILDYPVYTVRHLPTNAQTAVSTKFCVFGNLKAMAFGDKGEMRVAQYQSGNFGKEIALTDQTGIVYKHRHALVTALKNAFVVGKTAAS